MQRRVIAVSGTVQGVGFRPYVYGLARRHGLGGCVRNRSGQVLIDVEGELQALDAFLAELTRGAPPLAHITALSSAPMPVRGQRRFRIEASQAAAARSVFISPDVSTCPECLAELSDTADRRYRYEFTNCTNCGPRFTLITAAPYDRQRTTMAAFEMCSACRAEYENPGDRRFHAQPIACPACGPRLTLLDRTGRCIESDDPLAALAAALRRGKIAAIKGLGGFHLCCNARDACVVLELRGRKHRDEKPFAVMVRDAAAARDLCDVDPTELRLLQSPRRPIVLLRRRAGAALPDEIAPGNPRLGVLLPYTPLHHRLMQAMNGLPLVMTSGNRADEPIAFENEEAVARLADIADLFLVHDRPVRVRCDDSVTRVMAGEESPIRRSRGYVPQPIRLPARCVRPILAVGGQFKATFALGRGRDAILSHHLGDLDDYRAYQAFERDVTHVETLFALRPACIAHDLHPDYASTRYAQTRAAADGLRLLPVQHHHAHMASCMAEHGLDETVIGVCFDGTGYGLDGAIWGGEFLVGDYRGFRRAAHLRYVPMPGGDQAVREPWRMALAHLLDAHCDPACLAGRLSRETLRTVERMIARRLNAPATSSAGRLFDAIAAMVGLRSHVSHEGQAAMELEWAAQRASADGAEAFEWATEPADAASCFVVDTRPLIRAVAHEVSRGVDAGRIARRFHATLVDIIAGVCARVRERSRMDAVVLSGGVFMNELLATQTCARLRGDGFRVHAHRLVPPNDGGLSLGQLAVAAAAMRGHQ